MGLIIVGAGEQGRVVLEAARAAGLDPLGFVHPTVRGRTDDRVMIDGLPVLGDLAEPDAWLDPVAGSSAVVALGDNAQRAEVFARCQELALPMAAVVHPRAIVLGGAEIGFGSVIAAGAVIGVGARVGANAIVNTAATVDHDNDIGAHTHVAPGAHLAGRVHVGEGTFIGVGAAVRDGVRIGSWAVVAAGAVVIRDVADQARVAGVPAQPMTGTAQ